MASKRTPSSFRKMGILVKNSSSGYDSTSKHKSKHSFP